MTRFKKKVHLTTSTSTARRRAGPAKYAQSPKGLVRKSIAQEKKEIANKAIAAKKALEPPKQVRLIYRKDLSVGPFDPTRKICGLPNLLTFCDGEVNDFGLLKKRICGGEDFAASFDQENKELTNWNRQWLGSIKVVEPTHFYKVYGSKHARDELSKYGTGSIEHRFAGYYIRGIIDYAAERFSRDHSTEDQVSIAKELTTCVSDGLSNVVYAQSWWLLNREKRGRTWKKVRHFCKQYLFWQIQHLLILQNEIYHRYTLKPSELDKITEDNCWPWQRGWEIKGSDKIALDNYIRFLATPQPLDEETETSEMPELSD